MRRFFTLLLVLVTVSSTYAFKVDFKINPTWSEVMAEAKKKKLPVFVDFYTSWCGYCKKMDAYTFTDSAVSMYSKLNFIAVKMDAERGEGRQLAAKFGVRGYPTIVYVNYDGGHLGTVPGYKPANNFRKELKTYKSKSKTREVLTDVTDFSDFFELAKPNMDNLHEQIEKSKDAKVKMYENQAYQYGIQRSLFQFNNLKNDVSKMNDELLLLKIDMLYHKGANNVKNYTNAIQKLLDADKEPKNEAHLLVLELMSGGFADVSMLKIINRISLKNKSTALYETKAMLQIMLQDLSDVKGTLKLIKKQAKKEKASLDTYNWLKAKYKELS